MTQALAGALAAAVLVVGGLAGLALSLGPRTDEGGPVFDDRLTTGRIVVAVLCGVAVVGGALVFGVTNT